MQNDLSSNQPSQGESGPLVSSPAMSADALARRRTLLKGLSRSSAVLAMAVPISTLAAPTIIGGGKLCTVSGVHSNIGSHPTDGTHCQGFTPRHWATLSNWPNYSSNTNHAINSVDGISFDETALFSTLFRLGSGNSLLSIVANNNTSEAVWVTALLNAIYGITQPAMNFPYSPTQVRSFYSDPDPAKRGAAFSFFNDYMQSVV